MLNKLLNEGITRQVQEVFKQLQQPVQVLFFESQENCDSCEDTRQLVEEVVQISDKLSLRVYDIQADSELAYQYNVDKTPSLVLTGKEDGAQLIDYGIRFAGIPSGHEFSSLIKSLLLVSSRDSGLSPKTRQALKGLKKPVHLQVFVTPT